MMYCNAFGFMPALAKLVQNVCPYVIINMFNIRVFLRLRWVLISLDISGYSIFKCRQTLLCACGICNTFATLNRT